MNLLALDGQVDNRDDVIEQLRTENRKLAEDLRLAKLALTTVKSENESVMAGVNELRNLLTPLYRGLRLTFGEMDALPLNNAVPSGNGGSTTDPKRKIWENWIDKFGDSLQAKMVAVLLEHGSMSTEQLRVAMQCSGQSVINTYNRLLKHGLISKSGGKYALKEI